MVVGTEAGQVNFEGGSNVSDPAEKIIFLLRLTWTFFGRLRVANFNGLATHLLE